MPNPETQETRWSTAARNIVADAIAKFGEAIEYEEQEHLPSSYPEANWIKIPEINCVFVDMVGSTVLSAGTQARRLARIYSFFTETAVRILDLGGASYIDVKGDGVFGIFNGDEPYRAFTSAITFKTFADLVFKPRVENLLGNDLTDEDRQIGAHIGIANGSVMVKKVGMRNNRQNGTRRNEVWAGRPVNMAAKLAARAKNCEIAVSDNYYGKISDRHARFSCDCKGDPALLWESVEIDREADKQFNFDRYWILRSDWCESHGKEYCDALRALDRG